MARATRPVSCSGVHCRSIAAVVERPRRAALSKQHDLQLVSCRRRLTSCEVAMWWSYNERRVAWRRTIVVGSTTNRQAAITRRRWRCAVTQCRGARPRRASPQIDSASSSIFRPLDVSSLLLASTRPAVLHWWPSVSVRYAARNLLQLDTVRRTVVRYQTYIIIIFIVIIMVITTYIGLTVKFLTRITGISDKNSFIALSCYRGRLVGQWNSAQ